MLAVRLGVLEFRVSAVAALPDGAFECHAAIRIDRVRRPADQRACEAAIGCERQRGAPPRHHLAGIAANELPLAGLTLEQREVLLLHFKPGAVVPGLDQTPANRQPMTGVVHLAFDSMVGLGSVILLISVWGAWRLWRKAGRGRGVAPR